MKLSVSTTLQALTCCAILTGCSQKAQISLVTAPVTVADISESVTATGTVESVTSVDVGTQVTGIIDKIYVDYNSQVTQGQLIAEIEKTLLESELKSADANMESARLKYEYDRTNYLRDKALHDKQLISDYEFETSENTYKVSKTAYEKSQADRVKAAKNLNYAEIYAPIDGVVISRDVEVGQTVVSNMTVANLFTIADLTNMQVVANVDEADIGQVKTGQAVTFTVDAFPDDKFEGTVTQVRLNPTTESNVVTYEVIVAAPNPELKLIPGLTANVTIYVTQDKGMLTVPNKALRFTPHEYPESTTLPAIETASTPAAEGQAQLWIVKDSKLKAINVTVGNSDGVNTAILSGVSEGDIVALEYSAATKSDDEETASTDQSPFAPQPPGKKK
jgi:HlyD family secretion protein